MSRAITTDMQSIPIPEKKNSRVSQKGMAAVEYMLVTAVLALSMGVVLSNSSWRDSIVHLYQQLIGRVSAY